MYNAEFFRNAADRALARIEEDRQERWNAALEKADKYYTGTLCVKLKEIADSGNYTLREWKLPVDINQLALQSVLVHNKFHVRLDGDTAITISWAK